MGVKDTATTADIEVFFTEPIAIAADDVAIRFPYLQGGDSSLILSDQQTTSGGGDITITDNGYLKIALTFQTSLVASATYGIQFGGGMVKDTEESSLVQANALGTTGFRFTMAPAELGTVETTAPTL